MERIITKGQGEKRVSPMKAFHPTALMKTAAAKTPVSCQSEAERVNCFRG